MMQMQEMSGYNNNAFELEIHDSSLPDRKREPLQLIWKDVSYSVSSWTGVFSRESKTILNRVSGCLSSGTMTALMGPSGCGKTTLLNCIAGKITGSSLKGNISLKSAEKNLRIGFVPQKEHLFQMFSVYETVLFASKINNPSFSQKEHKHKVRQVLQSLDMESVAEKRLTLVSGGQLKRVSIATELVSDPQILMLDEPTTGLDSMNSEIVIQLLKDLCSKDGPAIVATIHQPSRDVFHLFDHIYLLNKYGSCLFFGPPEKTMSHLKVFGFEGKQTNAAEYALEVANAKYGDKNFSAMTDFTAKQFSSTHPCHASRNGYSLPIDKVNQTPHSGWLRQFYMVFKRQFVGHSFKSPVLFLRVGAMILEVVCMCHLTSEPLGVYDGCASSAFGMLTAGGNQSQTEEQILKQAIFGSLQKKVDLDFDARVESSSSQTLMMLVFLSVVFNMLCPSYISMTVFPTELVTMRRELSNRWYNVSSLFAAITLNEIIAIFLSVVVYTTYLFWAIDLPSDMFRFWYILFDFFLISLIWSAMGLFMAIICDPYTTIALIATFGISASSNFFSGLFVPVKQMVPMARFLSDFSDTKHGISIALTAVFGYDRCSGGQLASYFVKEVMTKKSMMRISAAFWPTLNITANDMQPLARKLDLHDDYFSPLPQAMDDFLGSSEEYAALEKEEFHPSFVLSLFDIQDYDIMSGFVFLAAFCCIARLMALVALVFKCKSRRL